MAPTSSARATRGRGWRRVSMAGIEAGRRRPPQASLQEIDAAVNGECSPLERPALYNPLTLNEVLAVPPHLTVVMLPLP